MFDWILGVVVAGGLIGVAFLMFAENVVPPVPSELVMPLAGFAAAQGYMSFPGVVTAGTLGALAGALVWYAVGRGIGEARLRRWVERHGRWLTLEARDLDQALAFFEKHGAWAVFLGRLIPGVRTLISTPAGMARMRLTPFVVWTFLGTALWTTALAAAGYLLASEYWRVAEWLDPATEVLLVGVVAFYLFRVSRMRARLRLAKIAEDGSATPS